MKKIILLLILISSILLSSDYYYNDGEMISLYNVGNYVGLKAKNGETKESLLKILDSMDIKIEAIKKSSNDRFLLKISKNLNKELLKDLGEYLLPAYNLDENDKGWPLFIDKKIVVKFKQNISTDYVYSVLKDLDLYPSDRYQNEEIDFSNYVVLETKKDTNEIIDIANELYSTEGVVYSYPEFLMEFIKLKTPNDTYFPNQWHHNSTEGVSSEKAWDISFGSKSIKVAIIDDGYDKNHEDLDYAFMRNWNSESDTIGEHGIACAGVSAAIGNNSKGMVGICPTCRLIGAKFMGAGYAPQTAAAEAIKWATFMGADVINNSWGARVAMRRDQAMNDAIEFAVTYGRSGKGTIILFASGNDNREFYDYEYAGHPDVLAIGASSYKNVRSMYSSYGLPLDVVAPSSSGRYQYPEDNIFTTDMTGAKGYNRDGIMYQTNPNTGEEVAVARDLANDSYTRYFGGTSSAAPLVSGLAGLILSKAPNLTYKEVFNVITTTTDKIGSGYNGDGFSMKYGYGKVNAFKALTKAKKLSTCTPSPDGENCSNGKDDDCDGQIDTDDFDCDNPNNPDPCKNLSCGENTTCKVNQVQFTIKCECKDGYEEKNGKCILPPNCDNITCSNHGSCFIKYNRMQCKCDVGYHPEDLECVIDDVCTYNLCPDNSTCSIEDSGCYCNIGFHMLNGVCVKYPEGSICETLYCLPHSSCDEISGGCVCDEGYSIKNGECTKKVKSGICNYSNNNNKTGIVLFLFLFLFIAVYRKRKNI